MAIGVTTVADQGYGRRQGSLLDAATAALALYNLPQSVKLAMQRQQLENKGLALSNTGQDISNQQQQISRDAQRNFYNAMPALGGDINSLPQPGSRKPDFEGIADPAPNGYGDQSRANIKDEGQSANTNQNSSSGGISNDMTVKGTSAEEVMPFQIGGIDPYSTSSILHSSQDNAIRGGIPNSAPAMANGGSARGASQRVNIPALDLAGAEIPGSTQGGGPASSPFNSRPSTLEGWSFNSGTTADNAGSMPRETVAASSLPPSLGLRPGHIVHQNGRIYQIA